MITITSPQNQKIKDVIKLRESKARRQTGLFVLEGAREISRALASAYVLKTLYICHEVLSPYARELLLRIEERLKLHITTEVFAKLAVREGSDGLVAVLEQKTFGLEHLPDKADPWLLVLENIEKPGNFGALARSADGAGVDAIVVLDPKADPYNPNALRASVGALFTRPLIVTDHESFADYCGQKRIRILTASPLAQAYHFQVDLKGPLAIVLGSEAWGLSPVWQKLENIPVKIPMQGLADSLNVSVAGAVILYEALRQRWTS
ncbi:TrmH family RNA methyltransferase [Oligoflexus tunisiensis]|uniref:TrmH family RNA methyltransferase n=1 Tax=Oligoflexus tunisiensis TaxID=708132 RepID=UPI000A547C70|nr:RNA methyltransferase [Oligoflexus tunisiensis]